MKSRLWSLSNPNATHLNFRLHHHHHHRRRRRSPPPHIQYTTNKNMLINLCTCPPSSAPSKHFLSIYPHNPNTPVSKSNLSPSEYLGSSRGRVLGGNLGLSCAKRVRFRCAFSGNLESVLEAAGVLTAIIVVHESGHFLAAYLQGIHVSKFAIGFGPILAKFNAKNVEYSIRAFPLGGFVGFPDNDPDSEIPVDDVNLLKNRPILDRAVVVSAGVVANIVFAYVIVLVQVLSVGLPVQEAFPGVLIPEVRAYSAASREGLVPGDVVLAVNGSELPRQGPAAVSELVDVIKRSPNRRVVLKVARGDRDFDISITPDENLDGTGKIGVQLSPNTRFSKAIPKDLFEALSFSGREFWGLSFNVLDSLRQTFANFSQSASKLSGPVAIIAVGAEVARSNTDGLYQFAALLNLNLAVINLLPLPALDGGTLALILIEAARGGRKLPLEIEQRIMSSGIVLVILAGLFLIVRDTLNLDFIRELL